MMKERFPDSTATNLLESARRVLPAVVIAVVIGLVSLSARSPIGAASRAVSAGAHRGTAAGRDAAAERIDKLLEAARRRADVPAAGRADDLLVLRRAWLSAAGTIPSLEEIRRFEADGGPDRLERWLDSIVDDRRSAEHLARVLSRALVGNEQGPAIVFRRDRFLAWLADAIHARRPFDAIVRDMVSADGLWTGEPAVNFVTQATVAGKIDPVKLAGRVSRAMLGQRIDCAECHDHPFTAVTQAQFEGLAACFAQVRLSALGVEDDPRMVFAVESPPAMASAADAGGAMAADAVRRVPPAPPFEAEWMPTTGTRRERLAAWLADPRNRRFERAVANRVWQIAFGRAWHDPVDDVPDPPEGPGPDGRDPEDPLDVLGERVRQGDRDILSLLRTLFATRLFRLSSAHPSLDRPADCDAVAKAWAAFPLTRLSADPVMGAMQQATQLETIDAESHLITRTVRFFRQIDFVREYGEPSDGDPTDAPVTIPQALVRMNGRLVREMVEANPFTASGRIAGMASGHDERVEVAFLCCLTRRPSPEERAAVSPLLLEATEPGRGMEDVFWTLFNSAEFSWNH